MRDAQARVTRLEDYRPPAYLIEKTRLHFHLDDEVTRVESRLTMRRNPAAGSEPEPLQLHGAELELIALEINGEPLSKKQYTISGEELIIDTVPESFELHCVTQIRPQDNHALEGLYRSSSMYCTQCEAEGFRKITYFLDRPDVMSLFEVTVDADKAKYPVLLSNGNLIQSEDLARGRHRAVWEDPFPKPAYLFALVAGDLVSLDDSFTTCSGNEVELKIWVEEKDLNKCDHAMDSLKRSMRWDEEVYGREYDLNIFNIVAVDDFNMGAMENKSLNIFNTSCVLARPETQTDAAFQRVEAVVAHEYFHNWSGNRVTCRDWFQLSLKEGFTVFRDSEFSADMGSPTVKRVEDVSLLRSVQFAEDAGPMAHPVRPDSYMEISNFYTITIYEKGAEVVRMIRNLLGPEKFRAGSDLYFERHDGQAVTCDDFVNAMETAGGIDLTQFRRWYSQSGTPQLTVSGEWDATAQTFTLDVSQSCPPTPGQKEKLPFHIPLAMALLGANGAIPLILNGEALGDETVLDVTEETQQFVFENVTEAPVPSLLRGFSAPVKLIYDYSAAQLRHLITADSDGFCRWDAVQQLAIRELAKMMTADAAGEAPVLGSELMDAFGELIADTQSDPAMIGLMLRLPSESYLAEQWQPAEPLRIHRVREAARLQIAERHFSALLDCYQRLQSDAPWAATSEQIAARSLKNTALHYLTCTGDAVARDLAVAQYAAAGNMTDRLSALNALIHSEFEQEAADAAADFYQRFENESLVVNQWLQAQAAMPSAAAFDRVQELQQHPAYDERNPNKVRALIGGFCNLNPVNFHREDGAGYRFLAGQVIRLDDSNPQLAARLLTPLTRWRNFAAPVSEKMQAELRNIAARPELSSDVYEVVNKSLAAL